MSSPAPEVTPGLAAVRSWCGWHVAPSKTETVKVEGAGSRVVLLPSLKVTDCTEVRDESGSVVDVAGWRVRENGVARGSWRRHELYEFDITHGYDDMPDELQAIVSQIDTAGVGSTLKGRNAGPYSESYGAADLESQPISVRAVVSRYQLPPRP